MLWDLGKTFEMGHMQCLSPGLLTAYSESLGAGVDLEATELTCRWLLDGR